MPRGRSGWTWELLKKAQPDRYVTTPETIGHVVQKDAYDNFKIVIDGKESKWTAHHEIAQLSVGNRQFFAVVSQFYAPFFPLETAIEYKVYEAVKEGLTKVAHPVRSEAAPAAGQAVEEEPHMPSEEATG